MARTSPVTHIEGMTNHMTTQRPEPVPPPEASPGSRTAPSSGESPAGWLAGWTSPRHGSGSASSSPPSSAGSGPCSTWWDGWRSPRKGRTIGGGGLLVEPQWLLGLAGDRVDRGGGCRAHRRCRPIQLPARLRRRSVPGRLPALPGADGEGMPHPWRSLATDGETPPSAPTARRSCRPMRSLPSRAIPPQMAPASRPHAGCGVVGSRRGRDVRRAGGRRRNRHVPPGGAARRHSTAAASRCLRRAAAAESARALPAPLLPGPADLCGVTDHAGDDGVAPHGGKRRLGPG